MMQTLWGGYSKINEKAGQFLKNDSSSNNSNKSGNNKEMSDAEELKKKKINNLEEKIKENEALKQKNQENLKKIKELEEINKELSDKIVSLSEKVEAMKQIKIKDDQIIEELKKKVGSKEVEGFKEILNERFEKIKIDVNNFDIDYSEIIEKLKKINEEMNKTNITDNKKLDENITTKKEIKDENENKKEESKKIKSEEDPPKEEDQKLTTLNDMIGATEDKKLEEKPQTTNNSNNNNGGKKRRNKKKKNKQQEISPLEDQKTEKEEPKVESTEQLQEKPTEQLSEHQNIETKVNEQPTQEINKQSGTEIPPSAIESPPAKSSSEDQSAMSNSAIIDEITQQIISKIAPLLESHKEYFQKYLDNQINTITSKISGISDSVSTTSLENEKLKTKVSTITSELQSLQSQITDLETAKKENTTKDKKINSQNEKISSLEKEVEIIKQSKTEIEKKLNDNVKQIETFDTNYQTLVQTFKQFFLLLLEDDIFIDEIEKSFHNYQSPSFFESVYQLAKYIKPKIFFEYKKSFLLTNSSSISKIEKYNLNVNINEIRKQFNSISSLDSLLKENNGSEGDFIFTIVNELVSYVESLTGSILNSSKKNDELAVTIKGYEEAKKKEIEKMLSLQNEIKEKNSKLNQMDKLNVENKNLKSEIEKLNNKINEQLKENSEQIKEKNTFNDKINLISQQCEVFRVENSELLNKVTETKSEVEKYKTTVESLTKEINKLKENTSQLEKVSQKLKEQDNSITIKDNEYKKLQNSYMELETFLENAKKEKDIAIESYQKQISDLFSQNENYKNKITSLNESLSKYQSNPENSISSAKNIEELEAKLTSIEIENKNLTEQKNKLKQYSEEIVKKIQHDYQENEFLIDKRMISSILFKYFDPYTNSSIKNSLLETLANFMNYTNDERRKLGLSLKSGTDVEVGKQVNDDRDKLKKLGDELYDFILNS